MWVQRSTAKSVLMHALDSRIKETLHSEACYGETKVMKGTFTYPSETLWINLMLNKVGAYEYDLNGSALFIDSYHLTPKCINNLYWVTKLFGINIMLFVFGQLLVSVGYRSCLYISRIFTRAMCLIMCPEFKIQTQVIETERSKNIE